MSDDVEFVWGTVPAVIVDLARMLARRASERVKRSSGSAGQPSPVTFRMSFDELSGQPTRPHVRRRTYGPCCRHTRINPTNLDRSSQTSSEHRTQAPRLRAPILRWNRVRNHPPAVSDTRGEDDPRGVPLSVSSRPHRPGWHCRSGGSELHRLGRRHDPSAGWALEL